MQCGQYKLTQYLVMHILAATFAYTIIYIAEQENIKKMES